MNLFRGILFTVFAIVVAPVLTAQTRDTVRVTAATAVRAEPKANAAILTTVKIGATLEVHGTQGDWYHVATFVGPVRIQGYVLKRSVTLDKPASPPPAPGRGTGPASSAAASRFGMSAVIEGGTKPIALMSTVARVEKIAARVDSARAAAAAMPIGAGTQIPTAAASPVTYVWLIDDVAGARAAPSPKPVFVVQFREAPGISPDDFSPAIVELVGTPSGPRVMSALRGRVDQASRAIGDWDIDRDLRQEVIKATVEISGRGVAKVTPVANLAPGEYAIVMRPTGNKKFAGTSVLSASADGRVFGIAWVFLVK